MCVYVLHVSVCVATAQVRAMWYSTCCMPFTFHGLYSLLQIHGALLTITNTHTHPYTSTCMVLLRYTVCSVYLHVDAPILSNIITAHSNTHPWVMYSSSKDFVTHIKYTQIAQAAHIIKHAENSPECVVMMDPALISPLTESQGKQRWMKAKT